jgi:hypothetical protein
MRHASCHRVTAWKATRAAHPSPSPSVHATANTSVPPAWFFFEDTGYHMRSVKYASRLHTCGQSALVRFSAHCHTPHDRVQGIKPCPPALQAGSISVSFGHQNTRTARSKRSNLSVTQQRLQIGEVRKLSDRQIHTHPMIPRAPYGRCYSRS